SPESAALREAREEAGIEAQIVGFLGVQNHARSDGEGTVYLIFLCQHVAGEPQADSQETDRAAYLSLAQMDALDEPIDEFCRWVVERVLSGCHQTIPSCADTPYAPYLAFL
ncbi:MAG: NUDIX domain-containing protein, partial [Anaerolineales bacterium]|nr:NUDIX domain-containing protein [Anaerolineales bacterium]